MKKYLVLFLISFFLLFSFNSVLAQETKGVNSPSGSGSNLSAGDLTNPIGDQNDNVQALIGRIITAVMGVVGSIALLMFIYGGLTWMTSSGNQEKVKKGRDIILWSAVGLIIIFMSYALTRFVLNIIAS